ncbi:TPA: DUF4365 domain-containing protein [Vibrio parahaemolyticus]|nr:DUF4365 domain-containing protein [Vibrio parahaemolyticus]MBE3725479.1 DUF4365 domain-containing protein [Vibrio parahaemolyticus]MBE5130237.1 DUF4365 domain-containing protein [Vibrio parahaemolyticus]HAV1372932.1 DUF4365 domain-containing protein [Vibrio parahaemolyticus]HCE2195086.1 DUF4365 domain-containing protein [Vibrio parahaemolyticus]
MKLTSTQIGALAENVVANELMIESGGRLSPFQPIADDDGIDLLVYDKVTGNALPIQVKARTNTINKSGKQERSNIVHFEVRKATFNDTRSAILLCVLLNQDLRSSERTWLMPMEQLASLSAEKEQKFVIRANKQLGTKDKYSSFQCESMKQVVERLIQLCESAT